MEFADPKIAIEAHEACHGFVIRLSILIGAPARNRCRARLAFQKFIALVKRRKSVHRHRAEGR